LSKDAVETKAVDRRWSTLIVLSLGVLMIMLDATIVYVALPSIRQDLKLSEASLTWVVNAFTLAYSGSLLLGGRLGDLFGARRLFLIGVALFTLASVACGLANTSPLLLAARAAQGVGGAVVTAVVLSLIMNMFTDGTERARAASVYTLICVGGGSAGLLLGGVLTSALSWHWVFLVNLPIGAAVYVLCFSRLPMTQVKMGGNRLDVWGAVTVTVSLVMGVYAIVNGNHAGWISVETLGLGGCAAASLAAFVVIESRVRAPLVPLGFFTSRDVLFSNAVRALWTGSMSAFFFVALYMQLVLGYGPMQVGLAFLPANLVMAGFSFGLSAKVVSRFGIRWPISVGLTLGAIGMALLARMPVGGEVMIDVVPGTILVALGAGIASIPLLFATMSSVVPRDTGLASGVVGTVAMVGNALGLAVLVSLSSARTENLLAAGVPSATALTGGYRLAFILAAAFAATAALISAAFLPREEVALPPESDAAVPPGRDVA
jgi:EmrB/QacA subfamily drug resistance transporter